MTTLLIKNIPAPTLRAIEALAASNHVTLEEQARQIIVQNTHPQRTREEKLALMEKIAAMTPQGIQQTNSALLIREDRDR